MTATPKKNPRRRKRRKKNMSIGAKVAIVAGVVFVGIPLALLTAGALGFRALVKKAEKDMPPLEIPNGPMRPNWFYWAAPADDGYWDAWVQRPDGQQIKANQITLAIRSEAERIAKNTVEQYGGNPILSFGPP